MNTAAPASEQTAPTEAPAPEQGTFLLTLEKFKFSFANLKQAPLQPIALIKRNWVDEIGPMLAVFSFAFCLYGITSSRKVTLEDDGLFLMNLEFLGVSHPPGYPLYNLIGSTFYHLLPEFLSPALRGHLFSGFCGALACVAIYAIVLMLVRSRWCAFAAGFAYAASEAFWSQAIIAEVYTPNAMLYFTVLALCLQYAAKPTSKRRHFILYGVVAFVYGLGLSIHWPLLGLGSIGLALIVINHWKSLLLRLPLGAVCLALGLLPYVWMVFRSHTDVALNFYGGIDSSKDLWFYITRSGYTGVDNQEGVDIVEKIAFTKYFAGELTRQITYAGFAVAVVGVITMLRSAVHFWLAICLLVAWYMTGPLMITLINFKAEFIWFSAFRVYHLLCYGITVIFFGYGLAAIGEWIQARSQELWHSNFAVGSVGFLVTFASLVTHWEQNDRSDYTWAHNLSAIKLISVEPNAHLFTFDDLDLPVGYLNYVERIRPDLTVYNDQGLVFANRVYSPFTTDQQRARVLGSFIERESPRPVYYHSHREKLFTTRAHGSDFLGFWRRVNQDGPSNRVILTEQLRFWLEDNLDLTAIETDRWTKQQALGAVATLISAVVQAAENGHELSPQWEDVIAQAREKNHLVRLFMVWKDMASGKFTVESSAKELAWINNALANQSDYIFSNGNWTQLLFIKAQIFLQFPEHAPSANLAQDIEDTILLGIDFHFGEEILNFYADVLRGQNRRQEVIDKIKQQYPAVADAPAGIRDLYNLLLKERDNDQLLRPVIMIPETS